MKDIPRFIVKSVAFAVVFLVLDSGFVLFHYRETNIFAKAADDKMMLAAGALVPANHVGRVDWLFMGSSHAQFGFDTDYLEERSGYRAYNLGYGGGYHLGEQVQLLRGYLARLKKHGESPPRLIVLAIDVFALNANAQGDGALVRPFVTDAGTGLGWLDRYRAWLRAWPVHLRTFADGRNVMRYVRECWKGNCELPVFRTERREGSELEYFTRYDGYVITPSGFVAGNATLNPGKIRYGAVNFAPRRDSIEAEFVGVCRDHGVRLVLVQLPEHAVALAYKEKYAEFAAWMTTFAEEWQVQYLDLNNPTSFPVAHDDLFFDSDHLNRRGARALAERLLRLL
jgi:hypothetical protein